MSPRAVGGFVCSFVLYASDCAERLDRFISAIMLKAGALQRLFFVCGLEEFMSPRVSNSMHVAVFALYDVRDDLIRSLCTISFFSAAADVSSSLPRLSYRRVHSQSAK